MTSSFYTGWPFFIIFKFTTYTLQDLSDNHLAYEFAEKFIMVLQQNSTLTHVTLMGNHFDDRCAVPLADAMMVLFLYIINMIIDQRQNIKDTIFYSKQKRTHREKHAITDCRASASLRNSFNTFCSINPPLWTFHLNGTFQKNRENPPPFSPLSLALQIGYIILKYVFTLQMYYSTRLVYEGIHRIKP